MVNATNFDWSNVVDRRDEKVEFGACHENYAWRPHKIANHKFSSLSNAFDSETNSIRLLLQHANGNQNARSYQERGRALFAVVWYPDTDWAVLCNSRYATLVPSAELKILPKNKSHDSAVEARLRSLFGASPTELWRALDPSFYQCNIAGNRP